MNSTTSSVLLSPINIFDKKMRLINLIISCSGILCNLILLIIVFQRNLHQCTTYFVLLLMILFDLIYCIVYTSILLTIDEYINLINHQILCPLSFFLTPFTFTGSTLLLFICLLHLITNYNRRYDTILGQIGGRLSVVFVFAFIIIRSVLGSTSIELINDGRIENIQHCTIDMNTPSIVTKVQNINHIFAEVTDIILYIGWIILFIIYLISKISSKKSNEINSKSSSFVSFLIIKKDREEAILSLNKDRLRNKKRHKNVSLIILSISLLSIIFYFPVMLNKFVTMNLIYREKTFLNEEGIIFLQIIQQTTHLFCLTIRFIPYFLFDKRIQLFFHQIIGFKFQRKYILKKDKHLIKFICHCQCSRKQQSFQFNSNNQL